MSAIANIACIWRQLDFDKGDRIWNSASTLRTCVYGLFVLLSLSRLRSIAKSIFFLCLSPTASSLPPFFARSRSDDRAALSLFAISMNAVTFTLSHKSADVPPWNMETRVSGQIRALVRWTAPSIDMWISRILRDFALLELRADSDKVKVRINSL